MKTKLILLGGVPGTGKTTVAYNLALKLKIDKVISVDLLKMFAKTYNTIFDKYILTTTHEAYKLENLSVIDGYLKHSLKMNEVVLNVLNNIKDNVVIIEGCTINKDFIEKIDKSKYDVVYFNLCLPTKDLIKRYEIKSKLRKSNWIENIENINKISEFLYKDNNNIINYDLEKSVERIVYDVKEVLHI